MPLNDYMCWTCNNSYGERQAYYDHFADCDECGFSFCANMPHECEQWQAEYDDDGEYSSGPGIYDYSHKPSAIFHGTGDYYLGIELEISADVNNANPIYHWANNNGCPDLFYCKEDGSVAGFEIVTHPMTREYFDSVNWAGFFAMLNTEYPLQGGESSEHGLHVHVSRSAFGRTSAIARWAFMLNRYRAQVEAIARRSAGNWARFTDNPVSQLLPYRSPNRGRWVQTGDVDEWGCATERYEEPVNVRLNTAQTQTHTRYPERYRVVNMLPEETLEVRVFRSTRDTAEFQSSVHFVSSMVDYVRDMQPCNATRHATMWESFAAYVADSPVYSYDTALVSAVGGN